MGRILTVTYQWARRCVVAVIGTTVILIGVAMLVLPGPAFVVIPAGLAILGVEFAFARRWLHRLRETGSQAFDYTFARLRRFRSRPSAQDEREPDDARRMRRPMPARRTDGC
jgi:tellurite resistance protein TerC